MRESLLAYGVLGVLIVLGVGYLPADPWVVGIILGLALGLLLVACLWGV